MFKTVSLIALSLLLTGSAMAQDTGKKDTADPKSGNDKKSSDTQTQNTKSDSGQSNPNRSTDKVAGRSDADKKPDSPSVQWGDIFTISPTNYTSLLQLLDAQYGNQVIVSPDQYPTTWEALIAPANRYQYIPNQNFPNLGTLTEWSTQLDKPVELDLKNVLLKDALKTLLHQVNLPFEFAKDVPAEKRVTLKAKGIRLQTALNAITEIAGVGWRPAAQQENAQDPNLKLHIQITKDRQITPSWSDIPWSTRGVFGGDEYFGSGNRWNDQGNSQKNNWYRFFYTPEKNTWNYLTKPLDPNSLNKDQQVSPPLQNFFDQNLQIAPLDQKNLYKDLQVTPPNQYDLKNLNIDPRALQNFSTFYNFTLPNQSDKGIPQTQTPLPNSPSNVSPDWRLGTSRLLYDATKTEIRSVFTCPHCHEQVTVVKKHVALKCPTCGRNFQDDWKFCPFDGAKRPVEQESWKFCPHCGKPVS